MSEAKHTKGPWQYHSRLSGSENHRGFRVYGPGASGWTIAELMPVDEDGIEGEANAKLIAAAPSLLEALQLIASTHPMDAALDPQRAVRVAREAIAKATGAEPPSSPSPV